MVHRIHDIHGSVYLCALCILHQGSWNKPEEQFIIIPSNQLDYPASSTLSNLSHRVVSASDAIKLVVFLTLLGYAKGHAG